MMAVSMLTTKRKTITLIEQTARECDATMTTIGCSAEIVTLVIRTVCFHIL